MTCSECGHEHTGVDLAGICIGCPCPHVIVYDANQIAFCADDDEPWPCAAVQGTEP